MGIYVYRYLSCPTEDIADEPPPAVLPPPRLRPPPPLVPMRFMAFSISFSMRSKRSSSSSPENDKG